MVETTLKRCIQVLALALPLAAAPPAGFVQWKAAQLKDTGKALAPKMDAAKMAMQQYGRFGKHSFQSAYREASGQAELHETQADIFVVNSGVATLIVGGKVVGGSTTAPNEIRGTSIDSGEKVKLEPGDIVNIPAKTPHQVVLEPGAKFTYFIVKVDE
jgi:mannose-6-phosphate isomerase-like protein (cupin superfamily)